MVKVTAEDLHADELEIMDYVSEDSDNGDKEILHRKFAEIEPLATISESFPNVIIVVGIPRVSSAKYEKLMQVLKKKISEELQKKKSDVQGFTIDMPVDDNLATKGFCCLSFPSSFEAQHAVKALSGFSLDSKHKFMVVGLDNFDEIVTRKESYEPPKKLLGFTREDFRWWLHDERAREQFVIRFLKETEIYWHDHYEKKPILAHEGEMSKHEKGVRTDSRIQWSPQGSYLATLHKAGVALWAGPKFEKKIRFEHKDVKQIEFSTNEEYIITWDGSDAALENENAVRIWKVISAELLRSFPTPRTKPRGTNFPLFLWSHDDNYIARCHSNELCVYELPSMTLTVGKNGKRSSLKYPLQKFDWSPKDNILSVWIPPTNESPGRLVLVEIPSRNELASKNVYNVIEASMHWQYNGDYLCLRAVLGRRSGKKKRREYTQLEIFRMRERNIPVDTVLIEDINVKQLHWEEGHSKRFAVIGEEEITRGQAVRFYRVSEGGATRDTVMVASYDLSKFMNYIRWAPNGSNFILAAKGTEGMVLFCTLNENDKVEVLHRGEHFMVNEIKWSSCGRYVATIVSVPMGGEENKWRYEGESGFAIWTFQGRMLYNCKKQFLYQFHWRPHPPPLLDDKKIDDIKKNLKDYSKKFDLMDEKIRIVRKNEFMECRKQTMIEFENVLNELRQWRENHELYEEWAMMEKSFYSKVNWEEKTEYNEEVLDIVEEILGKEDSGKYKK